MEDYLKRRVFSLADEVKKKYKLENAEALDIAVKMMQIQQAEDQIESYKSAHVINTKTPSAFEFIGMKLEQLVDAVHQLRDDDHHG